ncbi:MAG: hypothetical protein K6C36_08480, partial [Clostridia bacterium]|nr:hypothetical protein [Clostridia bacterium]
AEGNDRLPHEDANDDGCCDDCGINTVPVCPYCGKTHKNWGILGQLVGAIHYIIYGLTKLFSK